MPDPHERHGRPGRYDYADSQPSRSQQKAVAAQEPAGKRPPGKKDRDLCKGRHWKGPHVPEVRLEYNRVTGQPGKCGWRGRWWSSSKPYNWTCSHVLKCSGCEKDFGGASRGQCPYFHEITDEERQSVDAKNAAMEKRQARWKTRTRRIITGPQGYRKKKT